MHFTTKKGRAADPRFYFARRRLLRKSRFLLRCAQIGKALVVLGPLRPLFIRYHRKFNNNAILPSNDYEVVLGLDVEYTVTELKQEGLYLGARIPADLARRIRDLCGPEFHRVFQPHRTCEAVQELAYNSRLLNIVRLHLGAEPILWNSALLWRGLSDEDKNADDPRLAAKYDDYSFHYDIIDYKSLTIFVYLTDVDINSSPHVFIKRTHMDGALSKLLNIVISDKDAKEKYGDRIKVILGDAGSMVMEEISGYHKVCMGTKPRLALKLDYALQRSPRPDMPGAQN